LTNFAKEKGFDPLDMNQWARVTPQQIIDTGVGFSPSSREVRFSSWPSVPMQGKGLFRYNDKPATLREVVLATFPELKETTPTGFQYFLTGLYLILFLSRKCSEVELDV